MQIKFLISNHGYNVGEIASFDEAVAEVFVERGIAEVVPEPKPKAAKAEKVDF